MGKRGRMLDEKREIGENKKKENPILAAILW